MRRLQQNITNLNIIELNKKQKMIFRDENDHVKNINKREITKITGSHRFAYHAIYKMK